MGRSIMWDYIDESPLRLRELVTSNQIDQFIDSCDVGSVQKIIFVASGSSLNIGIVTKKLFETYANIIVETLTPSEFMDKTKIETNEVKKTLVIAISQTGTSTGTVEAAKYAKNLNYPVLTISEREYTPIQKTGDYYLNFLCGLEDCNAKTKGYNSSLVLLQLLAMKMAKARKCINEEVYKKFEQEIERSIQTIPNTVASTLEWLRSNKHWATMQHFLMIGYGTNYGTAIEGMLKVLETMCIPASICEIGEFSHGFHRTIDSTSNIIMIQTDEYGFDQTEVTIPYLRQNAHRLLVVSATNQRNYNADIVVEHHPITCSALNLAVVFQVISVYLPEVIGLNPNRESNDDYTNLVNTRVVIT